MSNYWRIPWELRSKALAKAAGLTDRQYEEDSAMCRADMHRAPPFIPPAKEEEKPRQPEPAARPTTAPRVRYYNPSAIQWLQLPVGATPIPAFVAEWLLAAPRNLGDGFEHDGKVLGLVGFIIGQIKTDQAEVLAADFDIEETRR